MTTTCLSRERRDRISSGEKHVRSLTEFSIVNTKLKFNSIYLKKLAVTTVTVNLETDNFSSEKDNSSFESLHLHCCCLTLVKKICFVVLTVLPVLVLMLLQSW